MKTLLSFKKTIGILGGMGPVASANLYYKIIQICQEQYHAEQDHEFPPMIMYNLPLTGFDETGFSDPEAVKQQLIAGVQTLERAGADFIIIACNTVHHFYDDMQGAVHIPILNIVDEVVEQIVTQGHTSVGLFTSESTNMLQIYEQKCLQRNIHTVSASREQQELINQVILHVMTGHQGPQDLRLLQGILDTMRIQNIEGIVLGCTEIPLAIQQEHVPLPLFDSTQIIAEAAIRASAGIANRAL